MCVYTYMQHASFIYFFFGLDSQMPYIYYTLLDTDTSMHCDVVRPEPETAGYHPLCIRQTILIDQSYLERVFIITLNVMASLINL